MVLADRLADCHVAGRRVGEIAGDLAPQGRLTIIRRAGRKRVAAFEHFAEHRQDALDAATTQGTA